MAWQKIDIPDTSDCGTCQRRDRELWEILPAEKIQTLGSVQCHECGRTYEAIALESDLTTNSEPQE